MLGRVLMNGCLVALGDPEEVDQARRTLSEFDNLMFLAASPERIPWQNAFFTKILVPAHLQPLLASFGSELNRVLAPGGEIIGDAYNV